LTAIRQDHSNLTELFERVRAVRITSYHPTMWFCDLFSQVNAGLNGTRGYGHFRYRDIRLRRLECWALAALLAALCLLLLAVLS
jgi:hypothetical protein